MNGQKLKRTVLSAILIALAAVLSFVKIFKLPLGGSITLLSMLPIVMIVLIYGTKWGVFSAFAYSVIQLLFGIALDGVLGWGLSWYALLGTVLLDYIMAFTMLGFSGIFKKHGTGGIIAGICLTMVLRFLCHFASGVLIFGSWAVGNVYLYSVLYNGSFMLPEMVFTVIGAVILFRLPQIKNRLD